MVDREKAIYSIERCTCHVPDACTCRDCSYDNEPYPKCSEHLLRDALSLLKAQEREISRLKNHVDCEAAETTPEGCVGYGRGFNDDEPCETCKQCPAYIGYDEE